MHRFLHVLLICAVVALLGVAPLFAGGGGESSADGSMDSRVVNL